MSARGWPAPGEPGEPGESGEPRDAASPGRRGHRRCALTQSAIVPRISGRMLFDGSVA